MWVNLYQQTLLLGGKDYGKNKKQQAEEGAACSGGHYSRCIPDGGTYHCPLSDTDTKANTFPGSSAIKLQLNRPKWDGYTDGSGDGTSVNPAYAGADTLGLKIAQSYQPNSVIPKNPSLTNISDDSTVNNEYVAMKVVYQVRKSTTGDVATQGDFINLTYDQFASIATINFDTAAWNKTATTADKGDVYCYGSSTALTSVEKRFLPASCLQTLQ